MQLLFLFILFISISSFSSDVRNLPPIPMSYEQQKSMQEQGRYWIDRSLYLSKSWSENIIKYYFCREEKTQSSTPSPINPPQPNYPRQLSRYPSSGETIDNISCVDKDTKNSYCVQRYKCNVKGCTSRYEFKTAKGLGDHIFKKHPYSGDVKPDDDRDLSRVISNSQSNVSDDLPLTCQPNISQPHYSDISDASDTSDGERE